eukprot:760483-Hanusia_phi.AAC.1
MPAMFGKVSARMQMTGVRLVSHLLCFRRRGKRSFSAISKSSSRQDNEIETCNHTLNFAPFIFSLSYPAVSPPILCLPTSQPPSLHLHSSDLSPSNFDPPRLLLVSLLSLSLFQAVAQEHGISPGDFPKVSSAPLVPPSSSCRRTCTGSGLCDGRGREGDRRGGSGRKWRRRKGDGQGEKRREREKSTEREKEREEGGEGI